MQWQETNGRYRLQQGEYRAEVWQMHDRTWVGRIGTTDPKALAISLFQSPEDAQAWCLTELAKMRRTSEKA